jgi:hypothetical protein
MRQWSLAIIGGALAAAIAWPNVGWGQRSDESAPPEWVASPAQAGPDLPPTGRSLFDFVATREVDGRRVYDIPFPFEAFTARVAVRAGCEVDARCIKAVLIPLGRSLQRTAAAPEYFKYPRAVVAVDGEPPAGAHALLKDRLYLGYHEKAAVIEAISWNEAAGRFEFQIVQDYRPGGAPRVSYARRAVCTACHQNLAPIYSRQVWDETNANPRVAAALAKFRDSFYGIPVHRGVDIPDAIDAATDRANRFALMQRLWREACGTDAIAAARCRSALLTAALQYRLTGDRTFDARAPEWREAFLPVFDAAFSARWPGGLAIGNPDIPNRDPLLMEGGRLAEGLALAHVAAPFDPLAPRRPIEVLRNGQANTPQRVVAWLAGFIAAADVRALDEFLAARTDGVRRTFNAPCKVAKRAKSLRFDCSAGDPSALDAMQLAGSVRLGAGGRVAGGTLNQLAAAGASLTNLSVVGGTLDKRGGRLALEVASASGSQGLRGRLADGAAITGMVLTWPPTGAASSDGPELAASVRMTTLDSFPTVRAALDALAAEPTDALGAQAFGRARVLSALFIRLGVPERTWCCENVAGLPPAVAEPAAPAPPADGPAQRFAAFYPLCATCHATESRFPPNFLAGSSERVAAAVRHCAPRIYVRLAMWRVAPADRAKTPMPPPFPTTQLDKQTDKRTDKRTDKQTGTQTGTQTDTRMDDYAAPSAVASLAQLAADIARDSTGTVPPVDSLPDSAYERLPPCLPGA